MIKLDKEFSTYKDKHQWVLERLVPSSKNQGKMTVTKSFHGTLKQVCNYILDIRCGECKSTVELLTLLEKAQLGVLLQVNEVKK